MLLGKANVLVNDRLTSMPVILLAKQIRKSTRSDPILVDFLVGLFFIETDQALPNKRIVGFALTCTIVRLFCIVSFILLV